MYMAKSTELRNLLAAGGAESALAKKTSAVVRRKFSASFLGPERLTLGLDEQVVARSAGRGLVGHGRHVGALLGRRLLRLRGLRLGSIRLLRRFGRFRGGRVRLGRLRRPEEGQNPPEPAHEH